ncbi:MAG: hypothetical protein EBZ75_11490 [Oxalobacteraceae bacterium]|nr:hypothetical protein [Oxalobacteraceae bacterium]
MNTRKLYSAADHAKASSVHVSALWQVRSYGYGQAITVHNRQDNTSLGIEGPDAYAVLAYADAMIEQYPTTPRDAIWQAVWRDFDMDEHARPHKVAPVEFV